LVYATNMVAVLDYLFYRYWMFSRAGFLGRRHGGGSSARSRVSFTAAPDTQNNMTNRPAQSRAFPIAVLSAFTLFLQAANVIAADSARYQTPAQAIVDMVDAPPIPQTILSPSRDWIMLLERPALPLLAELAQPELRLAGLRINPRTNDQSRTGQTTGIKLVRIVERTEKAVTGLPAGARIAEALWSPDGKRVAFTLVRDSGIELMVAEVGNGAVARRVIDRPLNGVLGRSFVWHSNSRSLIATLVPANRGAVPKAVTVASGPSIQENLGKRNAARTYQGMLKSPHDEALFEYYGASELVSVSLDGRVMPLASGLIRSFQPSPDGEYLLVQTIKRPYSYTVPISRFPLKTEIRDARDADAGRAVKVLSDLPLAEDEELDPDAVRKGPRQYAWRGDTGATITWVQPIEGRRNNVLGDQLFSLSAPFESEPQSLAKLELRYQTAYWGRDDVALIVEASRKTRRTVAWRVYPAEPSRSPVKMFDRSSEDRYGDPGTPVTESNARGGRVLNFSPDGKAIYLSGNGASPEGERPFIDRLDLETREARRLFRSEAPNYDTPIALFDTGASMKLLLQRESVNEAPNIYFRDLTSGGMQAVTRYVTPKNPVANVTKEVIRYKRKDGVELSANLYLPAGYRKEDGPLPLLMWAYPREFRSAEAAGQVSGSPYRYVRPSFSGPLPFLTQGYAVLDNPTMPIVGEGAGTNGGKEPNDTYLPQLIASAEAAIDEVVRRGVADRNKIAVGGHSYGAFMVANLLAHTKLFAAGIAESGAYNRTLTPFGFQAEDRTFWKARDVYNQMSPFNYADQIKTPLLLIHGEADSNTGTFPMQSERFYQAIRGLGGTVRLVMLPYEDHGYRGRESVLHRLWESQRWLDKYVKNSGKTG
jgi:dipeptidyl aminopeptidase/acylaminoacyl peptidase